MSDQGYQVIQQLKKKRHNEMSRNYCMHFVQQIFKKYDFNKDNHVCVKQLNNEWCSKHQRANLQHFSSKYVQIVEKITQKQHRTGYMDKMQLFQECKSAYEDVRKQQKKHHQAV